MNSDVYIASEYRSCILYYALPSLKVVLPVRYYHHFALLVCSMHILIGDSITPQ